MPEHRHKSAATVRPPWLFSPLAILVMAALGFLAMQTGAIEALNHSELLLQ